MKRVKVTTLPALLKMCRYSRSLLGHVSKIVSILLSKLSSCPSTDTSLCYCNSVSIVAGPMVTNVLSFEPVGVDA